MNTSVSVLLLVWNQQSLVTAALESLLAQQGEPIEIIVSDDASSDLSFERMQEAAARYTGPHRVVVRRNERNLGIGGHINALVECSSGELLVIAAGDDLSVPQRVERLRAAWRDNGFKADLIASPLLDMDAEGRTHGIVEVDDLARWRGIDDWIAKRPKVIGAGHAWTRRMHQHFGPFIDGIAYEDQIVAFRAIASGGALTVDEALVHYRRGGTSARTGTNDAQRKLDRLALQNRRHLLEIEQLSRDAMRTPHAAKVRAALSPDENKQRYVQALLASHGVTGAARVFAKAPAPVPIDWRLRKFAAVAGSRLRLR